MHWRRPSGCTAAVEQANIARTLQPPGRDRGMAVSDHHQIRIQFTGMDRDLLDRCAAADNGRCVQPLRPKRHDDGIDRPPQIVLLPAPDIRRSDGFGDRHGAGGDHDPQDVQLRIAALRQLRTAVHESGPERRTIVGQQDPSIHVPPPCRCNRDRRAVSGPYRIEPGATAQST